MKAYTKLTVVMRCQIVARKPSRSDRRRSTPVDKIRNFKKKSFSNIFITLFQGKRPGLYKQILVLCGSLYSTVYNLVYSIALGYLILLIIFKLIQIIHKGP